MRINATHFPPKPKRGNKRQYIENYCSVFRLPEPQQLLRRTAFPRRKTEMEIITK